jgi:hypothetical protein
MATTDDVQSQLATILAKPTSALEAGDTVRALGAQNGRAARELVREGAGQMADRTVNKPTVTGRPDQFGGAKFAREYEAPGGGENLRAAIEAAAGEPIRASTDRLVDALAATGWRDPKGSLTAFNAGDMKDWSQGGVVGKVVQGTSKPLGTIKDTAARIAIGRNADKLARLLASGEAGVRRIQAVQGSTGASARAALTNAGADLERESLGRERKPLTLRVRPSR